MSNHADGWSDLDVDADGSQDGGADGPHRGHHRRNVVLGCLAIVVVAFGGWFAVRWSSGGARQADVDSARSRLGGATTVPSVRGELRPAQGLYRYRGSGTDQLVTPPKEQAEGPEMPATVRQQSNGCWTFRIDYSTNHWQSWDYCPRAGGLDEMGGQTYQRWDFVVFVNESTSTFACDSSVTIGATQSPGDHWQQSCASTGTPAATSAGPYTFVGTEQLDIGGQTVMALHYHRERTMTGDQTGTEAAEVWFSADNGLPLRNRRRIEVDTATAIGSVHYVEDANFELESLVPGT